MIGLLSMLAEELLPEVVAKVLAYAWRRWRARGKASVAELPPAEPAAPKSESPPNCGGLSSHEL